MQIYTRLNVWLHDVCRCLMCWALRCCDNRRTYIRLPLLSHFHRLYNLQRLSRLLPQTRQATVHCFVKSLTAIAMVDELVVGWPGKPVERGCSVACTRAFWKTRSVILHCHIRFHFSYFKNVFKWYELASRSLKSQIRISRNWTASVSHGLKAYRFFLDSKLYVEKLFDRLIIHFW